MKDASRQPLNVADCGSDWQAGGIGQQPSFVRRVLQFGVLD